MVAKVGGMLVDGIGLLVPGRVWTAWGHGR
jgi:hypothetical protein